MLKKITFGIVIIGVAAAIVLMFMKRSGHTDTTFKTVAIERGTIIDKALAIGQLEPDNEIAVKSLTALIEPCILILLGVVVGFVAISLFLPLFDLTASAGGPR